MFFKPANPDKMIFCALLVFLFCGCATQLQKKNSAIIKPPSIPIKETGSKKEPGSLYLSGHLTQTAIENQSFAVFSSEDVSSELSESLGEINVYKYFTTTLGGFNLKYNSGNYGWFIHGDFSMGQLNPQVEDKVLIPDEYLTQKYLNAATGYIEYYDLQFFKIRSATILGLGLYTFTVSNYFETDSNKAIASSANGQKRLTDSYRDLTYTYSVYQVINKSIYKNWNIYGGIGAIHYPINLNWDEPLNDLPFTTNVGTELKDLMGVFSIGINYIFIFKTRNSYPFWTIDLGLKLGPLKKHSFK